MREYSLGVSRARGFLRGRGGRSPGAAESPRVKTSLVSPDSMADVGYGDPDQALSALPTPGVREPVAGGGSGLTMVNGIAFRKSRTCSPSGVNQGGGSSCNAGSSPELIYGNISTDIIRMAHCRVTSDGMGEAGVVAVVMVVVMVVMEVVT